MQRQCPDKPSFLLVSKGSQGAFLLDNVRPPAFILKGTMQAIKHSIPRAIWTLGFVSLFTDVSSETVQGLLPVFLVSVLGASFTTVGLIEGIGESAVLVLKAFSGPLSDWWGKRKPFVFLGYSMAAFAKPLFALASTPLLIFGARLFDRVGKGIRGAPRDALISDLTPAEVRGAAFGLRQSLDTIGAILGPLLAIVLMHFTNGNFRLIFWLATIPGIIAVLLIVFGVKEPEAKPELRRSGSYFAAVKTFRAPFWIFTALGATFQLARFSEAFLILRAQNLGLALEYAPLVLVVMNVVYALSAYPLGKLSDRMPRKWMVLLGFLTLALSDLILAVAQNLPAAAAGILLWGLHLGLAQGTLAALVADHSPAHCRGTAYGVFNLFSAVALLIASAAAGILWDHFGPSYMFFASGAIALIGCSALLFFFKEKDKLAPVLREP